MYVFSVSNYLSNVGLAYSTQRLVGNVKSNVSVHIHISIGVKAMRRTLCGLFVRSSRRLQG